MTDWAVPATVGRVIDADTVVAAELDLGWYVTLKDRHIRLYGVDAPEHGTPAGDAATAFVNGLLAPGDPVTVVSHKLLGEAEKFGRVLASITLPDGRDLSTVLLEAGHASPYGGGARGTS